MLRALYRALHVKPAEEQQVVLLLAKGFFMGVFITTFQVVAETLFMNRLGEYLREAILASGAVGIFATYIFAKLQERVRFTYLILTTQLIIFFITLACYLAFLYAPEQHQSYVVFSMFVLSGPFLAILLLSFWGVFGRMFDLRQSKRIIGGIDIGQLSAAIIASFSIPLLGRFIPYTQNFLVICCLSILFSAFFVFLIQSKFDLTQAEISKIAKRKMTYGRMFKDSYIRLLSLFLICSMVTFTFVQYSFLEVAEKQYPDENELRNFFAIFHGSILILGLLLQTFVNEKIISEYGMKVSLMIQPIILAVFTFAVIGVGKYFGITDGSEGETLLYFFLFIALSRLFNFSLRDSLENPVYKLYFMPLDNSERFDIQTKVEGVVNESARFVAGLLIIGLSYFTFVELIHYSYALIFLLSGYFLIIGKLYNEYRTKIKVKLQTQQQEFVDLTKQQQLMVQQKLEKSASENQMSRVVFTYKLLEKISPGNIHGVINNLMNSGSTQIREYAQQRMNEIKGLSVSDRYVINISDKNKLSDKNILKDYDLNDLLNSGDISKSRIAKLAHSEKSDDRLYAVELLSHNSNAKNLTYLVELLNDTNMGVRITALKVAKKFPTKEIVTAVINNLNNAIYANEAVNTLVVMGGKVLTQMDTAFYKTGQSIQVMIKLIQAMGRIGGNKAKQQLWNKIDYPDKVIVSQVLAALGHCNFKASISQLTRIKFAIETDVANTVWNLAAMEIVEQEKDNKELKVALEEEVKADIDHIYMLLGMLYDSQSIQLVKENIESGTSEGMTYGLELLDVFLSEDLKQKVLPVLDDTSRTEKVRKLELFYPKPDYEYPLLVKLLLNRDFNQANRYTKACVIHTVGNSNSQFYNIDLVAQLFNPDKMLKELAAWALYNISPEIYHEHTRRLGSADKQHLDEIILATGKYKQFDTIRFLKRLDLFKGTPGLVITQLIDMTDELFITEGEMVSIDSVKNNFFFVVLNGSVNLYESGNIKGNLGKGEFIGELTYTNDYLRSGLVIAVEDTILLRIPKDNFYELLSENITLAQNVVEYV
ncbi:MAG: cyclic nucleotide-binding domain-containing protein [Candidatus Cyclobacteriaceae bacterium M2_1C_046]